jgi:predicted CXXCH cytochrome family protein
MKSTKRIKVASLAVFAVVVLVWVFAGTTARMITTANDDTAAYLAYAKQADDDYVGTETCKGCHEDQFNSFAGTKHAKLADLSSWKGKVQGCESCHGPGKAHVEGGGDKTKITSFASKDSKFISETCLACHAGNETHNNFRRGEHWRNNVGCTECHSSHGTEHGKIKLGSAEHVGDVALQKPGQATKYMLKANEPQLCISCHAEMRAQFTKPFRHKVLEGAMTCSDCHNPHGGFESKQTKLALGTDAACIRCHVNKQGPFVFEHAPLKTEGCAACHTPHGAANPKLLRRNAVNQLCLECHSSISDQDFAPGAPGGHNQADLRYRNCTVCHVMIHGSNSHPRFFR